MNFRFFREVATAHKQNCIQVQSLSKEKINDYKLFFSAEVFLDDNQKAKTRKIIEKFRRSNLARYLQKALEQRAANLRNWVIFD